jgi:Protein of unknown function (DUF2799)
MVSVLPVAFCCCLLAAGCAGTGGPNDCAKTDWYRQGYADGWRTWYSRIDEHVSRCSAAGVKPDAAQYQRGWEQARFDFDHKSSGP